MLNNDNQNQKSIYEIEAILLANFIIDFENRHEIACRLTANSFTNANHKIIFMYLKNLFKNNDSFSKLDFTHYIETLDLNNKKEILDEIENICLLDYFIVDLNHYLKSVEEYSILTSAQKMFSIWSTENISSEEIKTTLDKHLNQFLELLNSSNNHELIPINRCSDNFYEKLNYLKNVKSGLIGISTGYNSLDKFLNGFKPGELIILAARPGVGKTSLALNILLHAAKNCKEKENVIMFSFEMSNEALYQKLIACESRVKLYNICTGNLKPSDEHNIVIANDTIKKLNIQLSSDTNLTILDIESNIRQLAKKSNVKLVIIDYLQLINSSEKIANRANEVAFISRRLKLLSLELKIPILALAQLSRSVEQRKAEDSTPKLSDLRESGAIEQDADIVLFLDQEQKTTLSNNENNKDNNNNNFFTNINLIIAKNRSGRTGQTTFIFDKETSTFIDNQGGN